MPLCGQLAQAPPRSRRRPCRPRRGPGRRRSRRTGPLRPRASRRCARPVPNRSPPAGWESRRRPRAPALPAARCSADCAGIQLDLELALVRCIRVLAILGAPDLLGHALHARNRRQARGDALRPRARSRRVKSPAAARRARSDSSRESPAAAVRRAPAAAPGPSSPLDEHQRQHQLRARRERG